MVQERPRLTGMLRSFFTERGAEFDLDKLIIRRNDIIKKRFAAPSTPEKSTTFSWKSFVSGLEDRGDQKETRQTFQKFIQIVKEMVGEGADGETSAGMVFEIVNANLDDPVAEKVNTVKNFFGGASAALCKEAVNLAGTLYHWREAARASKQSGPSYFSSFRQEDSDFKLEMDREFGADIQVQPPSSTAEQPSAPSGTSPAPTVEKPEVRKGAQGGASDQLGGVEVARELVLRCHDHCARTAAAVQPLDVAQSVLVLLRDSNSDNELQSGLLELLGYDSMDFMSWILAQRTTLLQAQATAASSKLPGPGGGRPGAVQANGGKRASPAVPAVGPQVLIQTESEKLIRKLQRKEDKKASRKGQGDGDLGDGQMDWLGALLLDPEQVRQQREAELAAGPVEPAPAGTRFSLDDFTGGMKMTLPEGTERFVKKGYEEVHVPPTAPSALFPGERLIPITDFEEWARPAFKGTKMLNRIQSRLFEAAYRSNVNILVCAPTGAGKTNIAMMTVLHELGQHIHRGVLRKEDFKIVYVAPMKALAAEVVQKFGEKLNPLMVTVKELTGDMQLTKKELQETQIIVTTPEKWDVITRKASEVGLVQLVRLLIIDEVHLLADERGAVIESIVARTLRLVETTQSMIRIVGLSATLPNYKDVAMFLRVPDKGLFFFDSRYRPVPLSQQYIGVSENNQLKRLELTNTICYDKVIDNLRRGHQVMVFVHSRKDTGRTARMLRDKAQYDGKMSLFMPGGPYEEDVEGKNAGLQRDIAKSRNGELKEVAVCGIGIHNAGMLRSDRNLVERLFTNGALKVLVCTATLAWGVNLPAHTVVIKGTQLYDSAKGTFVELSMLDVMQIFGRAGRPQYDSSGEGIIITTHDKLSHYLRLLNQAKPIESQFLARLVDHLNAEIVLGTVSNVQEAVEWLSYTYLFIRMLREPMVYGITAMEKESDPQLRRFREKFILEAAKKLNNCQMIRLAQSQQFFVTDLGRIASHFYIEHVSVEKFLELLNPSMSMTDILNMVASANEFVNVKTREEEMKEIETMMDEQCQEVVKGGLDGEHAKVNILLQAYIWRYRPESFSLVSDMMYISQSAGRIARALFEICLRRNWATMAERLLKVCKMIDRQQWDDSTPLRQFDHLSPQVIMRIENRKATLERLGDMHETEIGNLVNFPKEGATIKKCLAQFPRLALSVAIQPITRSVLRMQLTIKADFQWNDRVHGSLEPWWIWVEDTNNEHIYYSEYFLLHKKTRDEAHLLDFTIPLFEPLPPQYFIRAISDRWIGAEAMIAVRLDSLILPEKHPPHTALLDLQPLPVTALHNRQYESIYKFTHFNPIQTQVFHTCMHTDANVLLGAPTGSGKTIVAELAMFRLFNEYPSMKVIYIGPLKALVRERIEDWKIRMQKALGKRLVELTGDVTPDIRALQSADIVCTTPEKWDGVSRNWQNRSYVKKVGLIILDEIHLLGNERGPILEVIVSRMRYISSHTAQPIRFVGLSTALANARDIADWLAIDHTGLFNFKPAVRPVPLEAHIQGYPGEHYCPRMATMNKPTYHAIKTYSPTKPVIVFVSSRRQTRLTAFDLIAFCAGDDKPKQWLHMTEEELEAVGSSIRDQNLRHTLAFGIGLHHAGLNEKDKTVVEDLFVNEKIQVLVSTSTLAWGVNFPAHLVVIKGTEFYDPKNKRYQDYPITDVLQMMGRAGRPQFDNSGIAVILVHEPKKNFMKKFLYEPFPVESSLPGVLHDHFNAEVVGGTIQSKQDAMDYLTWTYFFRRLVMNPSYYHVEDNSFEGINRHLSNMVERTLLDLKEASCVEITDDVNEEGNALVKPTTFGRIASYYYLSYKTVKMFSQRITATSIDIPSLLQVLCDATEYDELPVRHNEDRENSTLMASCPWPVDTYALDSPHVKANLLLQTHFSRGTLPVADYITDTKSVLDQSIRIIQAMVDIAADSGLLETVLQIIHLNQMLVQGRFFSDNSLMTLPHVNQNVVNHLRTKGITCLPELMMLDRKGVRSLLQPVLSEDAASVVADVVAKLPSIDVRWSPETPALGIDEDATLQVELVRTNKSSTSLHTHRYPKHKDEGWWLVLADTTPLANSTTPTASGAPCELLALKRVMVPDVSRVSLSYVSPLSPGTHTYTLFLMSDSYLGLDQQYDITIIVK